MANQIGKLACIDDWTLENLTRNEHIGLISPGANYRVDCENAKHGAINFCGRWYLQSRNEHLIRVLRKQINL